MSKEVIILAGGLGTRLRSAVPDLPKCMAIVNGKPFLEHVMQYLETQFVDHVILSLGYKHEEVIDWLKTKAFTYKVSWVVESSPLGTGGAIALSLKKARQKEVFVMNGDTYFPINLNELLSQKHLLNAPLAIALKEMTNFDRYGTVDLDETNRIVAFREKQACEKGLINGGVYVMDRNIIDSDKLIGAFSFETDVIPTVDFIVGNIHTNDFIDIGVPEDYQKAQSVIGV